MQISRVEACTVVELLNVFQCNGHGLESEHIHRTSRTDAVKLREQALGGRTVFYTTIVMERIKVFDRFRKSEQNADSNH
jgi:hypothetical protein